MHLNFQAYNQDFVDRVRAGGPDAYGRPAETTLSDGQSKPCRSCLDQVPHGAPMLILAACPFPALQPYAETGPIFLCAEPCVPFASRGLPPVMTGSPQYLLKGYGDDDRIVYGTGAIVDCAAVPDHAEAVLSRPDVAYVDVRSARNNCFLTRITRSHDPAF